MQWRDPVPYFEASYIPEPNSGCWLWVRGLNKNGYGSMSVSPPVKGRRAQTTHRVAWKLFKGPIPAGMCVCHRCDVRSCVNPDHLFLGTNADNTADMNAKNRQRHPGQKGEKNGMAKLTAAEVLAIRQRRAQGENWKALAKEYGVHHQTIWKITSNMRWT